MTNYKVRVKLDSTGKSYYKDIDELTSHEMELFLDNLQDQCSSRLEFQRKLKTLVTYLSGWIRDNVVKEPV